VATAADGIAPAAGWIVAGLWAVATAAYLMLRTGRRRTSMGRSGPAATGRR